LLSTTTVRTTTALALSSSHDLSDIWTLAFGLLGVVMALLGVILASLQPRKMQTTNIPRVSIEVAELCQSDTAILPLLSTPNPAAANTKNRVEDVVQGKTSPKGNHSS